MGLLIVPRIAQRYAKWCKIPDVARDHREVSGERGCGEEAVHDGQRNAAPLALRHQVAPAFGNFLVDRQDSLGEARRQIKGGGLRVNDAADTDEKMLLKRSDLTPEGVIKLSMGKKRHVLLKPA